MKTTNLPLICGVALTAITTAGISHWWSVHQFVTAIDVGLPVITSPAAAPSPAGMPSKARPAKQPMLAKKTKATPTPSASPDQKELDVTVDYRFKKGFLKGLWLRARGAYLDQDGPNARDVSNIRLILNYDIQIM